MQTTAGIQHLLLVTPGFPVNEADTSCLPAVQQFVLCYKKKYPDTQLTVLTLHYPFDVKHYTWHGINVYSIRGKNKPGIARMLTVIKAAFKGRTIFKKDRFDAALSFWLTDASLAAKYIAKATGAAHLIWMHGQDARRSNKYVKYVNPKNGQIAVISAYQKKVFAEAHNRTAAYVVHNGINREIFPGLNNGQRDIDILAVGSLIPLKRYHLLVAIIKELKDDGYKKLNVVLAGEGLLHDALLTQIKALGLEDNITLTGGIPHGQVLELMNRAKLFAHTSEYEAHSTVLLEALYSGCHTLAFLPAGDAAIAHFTLCTDMNDMKRHCKSLLMQKLSHDRVLYTDMEESAVEIHNALRSML